MALVLNNATTADAYTDAATIVGGDHQRVNIIISDAPIYYSLQLAGQGRGPTVGSWLPERYLPCGAGKTFAVALSRKCSGMRFRSGTPGVPATVSAEMLTKSELGS
jgi:hypothetical protein